MQETVVPPRLSVLLARDSANAVVICRHKSKRTAIIGWDRKTDTFEVTQWLKGKLYPSRSDISPDGRHWVYFAMSERGRTYTVLAKVAYLKALDFYPKKDAWNGGGLFFTNNSYWLNDGGWKHEIGSQTSGMSVKYQWGREAERLQGEDPLIYFRRLRRDSWSDQGYTVINKCNGYNTFRKKINDTLDLIKIYHAGLDYPEGKSPYYEEHVIYNHRTGENMKYPNWQWADVDQERVLWAENGNIYGAGIKDVRVADAAALFETGPLHFQAVKAPY